jgi:hypothetical protein
MRGSEVLQVQWHAGSGIASGQGHAPQTRTVGSRKRLAASWQKMISYDFLLYCKYFNF